MDVLAVVRSKDVVFELADDLSPGVLQRRRRGRPGLHRGRDADADLRPARRRGPRAPRDPARSGRRRREAPSPSTSTTSGTSPRSSSRRRRGRPCSLGENGQGKTNLLEAIYVLATLKPLRAARLAELVRFGASRGGRRRLRRAGRRAARRGAGRARRADRLPRRQAAGPARRLLRGARRGLLLSGRPPPREGRARRGGGASSTGPRSTAGRRCSARRATTCARSGRGTRPCAAAAPRSRRASARRSSAPARASSCAGGTLVAELAPRLAAAFAEISGPGAPAARLRLPAGGRVSGRRDGGASSRAALARCLAARLHARPGAGLHLRRPAHGRPRARARRPGRAALREPGPAARARARAQDRRDREPARRRSAGRRSSCSTTSRRSSIRRRTGYLLGYLARLPAQAFLTIDRPPPARARGGPGDRLLRGRRWGGHAACFVSRFRGLVFAASAVASGRPRLLYPCSRVSRGNPSEKRARNPPGNRREEPPPRGDGGRGVRDRHHQGARGPRGRPQAPAHVHRRRGRARPPPPRLRGRRQLGRRGDGRARERDQRHDPRRHSVTVVDNGSGIPVGPHRR